MVCKTKIWLVLVAVLLMLGVQMPGKAHSREPGTGKNELQSKQLISDLDLSADKAKAFTSVGEHWDQIRQNIIGGIKENETDLEKAIAASKPDEGKINQLVNALITGHDQLFETFKAQRQEEMTLLTPVQRGKFLLSLKKCHEEQMGR